jgi:HPt (histidine-containing phosphotransfer) domain-containing protein
MTENNKDVIFEMIDIFIEQVVVFQDEMIESLQKKDFEAIGQLAHKAKSSVAIMGMNDLASKLKDFELKAKNGMSEDECLAMINYFKQESNHAIEELEEYKKNYK